ncbi:MAG TPA: hypothetical protein VFA29_01885 [Candidatus Baltobacteraceae bacterium]|nr:hypothetical protein [Candidatus Baltobacteraceae bacterium]
MECAETDLRRLLRLLHRPYALDAEPLARALCDLYGLRRSYDAVIRLVKDTLIARGVIGKRLYDLIELADIRGKTQMETAQIMGLSIRQFYRYRREAVKALTQYVRALPCGSPKASPAQEITRILSQIDPIAAVELSRALRYPERTAVWTIQALIDSGQFIDESAIAQAEPADRVIILLSLARFCFDYGAPGLGKRIFEAVNDFVQNTQLQFNTAVGFHVLLCRYTRARFDADVHTCDQIANELCAMSRRDSLLFATAVLVQTEAEIRLGDLERAELTMEEAFRAILPLRDLRFLGALVYYRAAIDFLRGDLERAQSSSTAALFAFRRRPRDRAICEALDGRIRFAASSSWSCAPVHEPAYPAGGFDVRLPDGAYVRFQAGEQTCFARMSREIAYLRSLSATGAGPPYAALENFIERAASAGYVALEAAAHAVYANVFERAGDARNAQRAYVRAWSMSALIGDDLTGRDLFIFESAPMRDLGPVVLDEAFLQAFDVTIDSVRSRSGEAAIPVDPHYWAPMLKDAFSATLQPEPRLIIEHCGGQTHVREIVRRVSVLVPFEMRSKFAAALTVRLAWALRANPVEKVGR